VVPLFVSSFRRASDLATAMECRCYRGGMGRTRMKQMKMRAADILSAAVVLAVIAALFALNFFIRPVL
jgi:energy-coupling factor transport system permease protein